jgi:hypothetical protein
MKKGTRLNGVIYLHRISDTRMGGTALRNNRMFRKLVGEDSFKSVVLATTFWERVTPAIGANREKELRSNRDFWGGMTEKGAKMARLSTDRASGLELLEQISKNDKIVLAVQDEMVNQGLSAENTSVLREETQALRKAQNKMEEDKKAARLKMQREAEEARQRAAANVRREQERLRKQREAARIAEVQRIAAEKAEAEREYQRRLKAVREERQREEARRARERAENERREREEAERQRKRAEEAAAEIVRRREEYQRNYTCIGYGPRWTCDGCSGNVEKYKYYYRKSISIQLSLLTFLIYPDCHFCQTDKYFHCMACGNDCGEATHPYMGQYLSDDDCIIM